MNVDQEEVTEEVNEVVNEQTTEPEAQADEAVEANDNEVDDQPQEGFVLSFGD